MVRVQQEDFDIAAEVARLKGRRTDIGAIVTFTGVARGSADGEPLDAITLEHYPGMTENELEQIEREARGRWRLIDALVVHRYGRLRPGDNIVLVITAASHRRAAFEAAEFLMDYLKTRAPFWKEETLADGRKRWVGAAQSDDTASARWTDDAD